MQSGLEAAAVSSFLHENMLDFLDQHGIEDAAGALDYLSITGIRFSPTQVNALSPARGWPGEPS